MVVERRVLVLVDAAPLLQASDACQRRAAQDGCLLWRRLLPPGHVLAAGAQVRSACCAAGWCDATGAPLVAADDADAEALAARLRRLPRWRQLGEHAALHRAMAAVLGSGVRCIGVAVDLRWPGEAAGPVEAPRDGNWSVWVPLEDCATTNAGLAVLPGSHQDGAAAAVTAWADMAAGDVLALDGDTLRQPLAHAGNRLRLAVHFRYRAPAEDRKRVEADAAYGRPGPRS